ncbi:MAG: dimethyl sulfoxide reductase anchor subunit [Nitrospinae bacterium]|nr:dimethyl sulfoxide reductase anchor subunit [Nitrospinota bacterium]
MHPEMSLVILTVLAGAGQGLFIFLVGGDMRAAAAGGLPGDVLVAGSAVALMLTVAGTLASFFHLTHPERGWKAMLQWRKSWLSREVVSLPAFQGLVALYGIAAYAGYPVKARMLVGIAGCVVAAVLFISSGMVYAKVRFIREWANAYTPLNFIFTGLSAGSAIALSVMELSVADTVITLALLRAALGVIAAGGIIKLLSLISNRRIYSPLSVQTALGVNSSTVRLMDFGSSYDHYNTKEYNYSKHRERHGSICIFVMTALYAGPFIALMADYMPLIRGENGTAAPAVAAVMMLGYFAERWFFFADANHVQNLYYGNFMVKQGANPLLQAAKRGTPVPKR